MASSARSRSTTRPRSTTKTPAAKKPAAKKPAAKKSAAKRPAAEKPAAKKPAAKRTAARTSAAKQAPAKRAAAKKSPTTKAAAKKGAATKTAATKTAAQYTKPALRERLKKQITAGTKGGRAGQWSARKAQLLAHAYEEAGGGYKGGRDERQRHLGEWTAQHWTTADGAKAERADGTHRYLPEKAWGKLTAAEKRATDRKKVAGSRAGRQFVANTGAARRARKASA